LARGEHVSIDLREKRSNIPGGLDGIGDLKWQPWQPGCWMTVARGQKAAVGLHYSVICSASSKLLAQRNIRQLPTATRLP
jgi:hypothetical protein